MVSQYIIPCVISVLFPQNVKLLTFGSASAYHVQVTKNKVLVQHLA